MTKMKKHSCDKRKDRVSRKIRNLTAKEMVDWMIKYHGLPAGSRDTVTMNLQEQFDWHQIQGRLESTAALANGLDAFWNAALGQANARQDEMSFAVASVMSEGFAAVAAELRKGGAA